MATLVMAITAPVPLHAEDAGSTVLEGRCVYPDRVARYRSETTLILCDTVKIDRSAGSATLDFKQRSWGSMARFAGAMSGGQMTVSQVTLRDGRTLAATGTCEIFYRNDGTLSMVSCLAQTKSRSIAANFVRSRI